MLMIYNILKSPSYIPWYYWIEFFPIINITVLKLTDIRWGVFNFLSESALTIRLSPKWASLSEKSLILSNNSMDSIEFPYRDNLTSEVKECSINTFSILG